MPPPLLYAQGPGNSCPDDRPTRDAITAQHRDGGFGRNGTEFSVSDEVVGKLQRINLDPDPKHSTLSPEQLLDVMTKMTSGTGKNELLIAQVLDLEARARRKCGFFTDEKKRLPRQWPLIDPVDDPLGVMNKDAEIDKPLAKLLMQQGIKAIDDSKTYAGHVSSYIGDQRRRNGTVQRRRHADGDLTGQ
jgi:hypothetical protein